MSEMKEAGLLQLLNDEAWRLQNLFHIKDKKGKVLRFAMKPEQLFLYNNMHYLNFILKARQLGISTEIVLWMANRVIFSKNMTAGIVDHTLEDAKEKLEKVRFAWEMLDNEDFPLNKLGRLIKQNNPLVVDNATEMSWADGGSIYCGTSLRGGTVQILHISELGPTAWWTPVKAKEIKEGAINTVEAGQFIFIESTHEGGASGINYEIMSEAMANNGKESLNPLEWKFFFFPWWMDASYSIDTTGVVIRQKIREYFRQLEIRLGRKFTPGQIAWYELKERIQKEGMWKEFPSTPEEAIAAPIKGAIYATKLVELRAGGQIRKALPVERGCPIYTSWDLGGSGTSSDWTTVWVLQIVGSLVHVLKAKCNFGEDVQYWVNFIRGCEQEFDVSFAMHFLPHDAKSKKTLGKSNYQLLQAAGLRNMKQVPRTPDIWIGINFLRGLLPRMYFSEDGCGQRWERDGEEFPSPLDALSSYRTAEVSTEGRIMEKPVHDWSSHPADGLRTFAEAWDRGMIPSTPKSFKSFADEDPMDRVNVMRKAGFRRHGRVWVKT